jgi:hypothetical protein
VWPKLGLNLEPERGAALFTFPLLGKKKEKKKIIIVQVLF